MIPSHSLKNATVLSGEGSVSRIMDDLVYESYRVQIGDRVILLPEEVLMEAGFKSEGEWTWHYVLEVGLTYDELDVRKSWAVKEGLT